MLVSGKTGQSKETHKRENRGQNIETTTTRETEAGDIEIVEGGKLSPRQRDHSGGEGEASEEKHHLRGGEMEPGVDLTPLSILGWETEAQTTA